MDAAFHVLNAAYDRTRSPHLCLAGGCAMNSVANGKIRERTPFRDVYIQPASSDKRHRARAPHSTSGTSCRASRGGS